MNAEPRHVVVALGCAALMGCQPATTECTPPNAVARHRSAIRTLGVGDDWTIRDLSSLAPQVAPGLLVLRMAPPGENLDGPEAILSFRKKDCALVDRVFRKSTS